MFESAATYPSGWFGSVGWADLVDILIVAFLIYYVLLFIKGTRAIQIILGLGFLFFCYWIADRFEFLTVRAILGSLFDNWIVIFILLFHQDIRRILALFGRTSFFSSSGNLDQTHLVEEITRSCISLANKKIGALIVIERDAEVTDFVESGVELDSKLTKEVITSVFMPVSPMHDGALVVRRGRVYMAGCFLPLSMNPLVSQSLGTRHRAALGITEETDALCIVVSEEKGTLSFAVSGKITHDLDGAQLRRLLLERLS